MANSANHTLIVGAGPVGLFLANECARRGLSFRLIEERSSQSETFESSGDFPADPRDL